MSVETAESVVREAYNQGVSDGHALNRARGIADELQDARAIDASRAELLAVLEEAMPFLRDHVVEVAEAAAGWPENNDGPSAVKTAAARVERAAAAIARARGGQ